MKLQLALDRLTKEECFRIVEETKGSIDIIEVGTGVIKEYGMTVVREMRNRFPDHVILADMKTCDAGKHEADQAFEAGADITTVMAFSADQTITDTLKVANDAEKQIMIDLLEVHEKEKVAALEKLGVRLVSLHVGKDKQTDGVFDTELFSLINEFDFEVAVAGGVNLDSLPSILQEKPDIIIVGSAITGSSQPKEIAANMKKMMDEFSEK
ncbi:3-hexulose-6-phosphate synthase [Bacillus sp. Marseille-Q3570]|uniref:3-hexulose-6-phosphate synthase n=1 Tax=Bacillus sp. Marseille-Q3570 TaxID=2963522 RepID=UPI0021B744F4|nr:3-hexulose-6-phosphate synthase [Bacillus sp. Marseille-Q3570]